MEKNLLELKINEFIDNLTNDEDDRQDLWIAYLEGNSVEDLSSYLNYIKAKKHIDITLLKVNPYYIKKIYENINCLTSFEQSIILLYTIGIDIDNISWYKGIDRVRTIQVINSALHYCNINC
jgi:hypothetical protein